MPPALTPSNRTCAPCDGSSSIRWGILACGGISTKFATAVVSCSEAGRVTAVASRSFDRAHEFVANLASTNQDEIQCFDDYADLATSKDVDVVYIGSPHSHHFEHVMLCLLHDKHVLCEKSFTINAEQARVLVDLAHKRGLFLMEAMWTRFFPAVTDQLLPRIARGDIGEVVSFEASFGFNASEQSESHRLFNPDLGGGALLDVGIYVVSLASLVLGDDGKPPSIVQGVCEKSSAGIDLQNSISLLYGNPCKDGEKANQKGQRTATLSSSLRARLRGEAVVIGTKGEIHLNYPFWRSTSLSVWSADISADNHVAQTCTEEIRCDYVGPGMQYEALEVARCIASGRLESKMMPLRETVSVMETMDKLRALWGVRYADTLETTVYDE